MLRLEDFLRLFRLLTNHPSANVQEVPKRKPEKAMDRGEGGIMLLRADTICQVDVVVIVCVVLRWQKRVEKDGWLSATRDSESRIKNEAATIISSDDDRR